MRLSDLNIWKKYKDRRAQQEREVRENSEHPKMVWDMRLAAGWGNSIGWSNWEKRSVHGHTTPLPKVGDELLAEMQSGRVGSFRFVKVNPCIDPSDMWFGVVEDIGYADEKELGHPHPESPKVGDIVVCKSRRLNDPEGYRVECLGWSEGHGVTYGSFLARGVAHGGLFQFSVSEWELKNHESS